MNKFLKFSKLKKRHKKTKKSWLGNRKRKVRVAIGTASAIGVIVTVVFIVWILRIEKIQIDEIVVTGNVVVKEEKLRNIVNKHIEGMYLWVLAPKTNILLYPQNKIEKEIGETFPRIKNVEVSFENLRTIGVEIEERKGVALWCGDSYIDSESIESCYFLDDEGILFAEAPQFSGNIFFKYFGSLSTTSVIYETEPFGHTFLGGITFKKMQVFIKVLSDEGFVPTRLVKMDVGDFEVWLEDGWYIVFKQGEKIEVLLDSLKSVLASDALMDDQKIQQLKYIDFRFGNKVYYKFDE